MSIYPIDSIATGQWAGTLGPRNTKARHITQIASFIGHLLIFTANLELVLLTDLIK